MLRRPLVAANWKMYGRKAQADALVCAVKAGLSDCTAVDVVLCPPGIYLGQLQELIVDSALKLGSQNHYPEAEGAFTGEVSCEMLAEFGCSYAIVGHSERRDLFGESDSCVAKKFCTAQSAGLIPILCVGESEAQRIAGETESVVAAQLEAVIAHSSIAAFANAIVAYEPIWAIGTGQTASPEQAQAVHAHIRAVLRAHDPLVADRIRLLYGGSVKAANASALFAQQDIDGGLVGGASLIAEEFNAICQAANGVGKSS